MVFKKHIELKKAHLYLIEEGYTSVVFKDNVNFDLEDAMELDEITYEWVDGKPFVTLVDARNIRSNMSHKARDHFAKNEKIANIRKGHAIVVNSLHIKLLANFYMKFHKPLDPVKIFTDYNKAQKWIEKIKENGCSNWIKLRS